MYLVKRNPRVDWTPRFVDRFFNDFWSNSLRDWEDSTVWTPRVDVKETKDAYEVLADLPGMEKKDINISLHDNVLTVSGERKYEKSEDKNSHFQERVYGNFSRSFRLPYQVDHKDVHAEYKNGVLKVVLQKSPEAKPREIEIK
ncbi:Hsp20/alpha crystallin family protein [candidate division KSB1 bacterium]|nr:Hsp20/alpha crystallin family protein [candidate division KSB1 bacterium]